MIALEWNQSGADLTLDGTDWLESAVILSLFTDRRALDADPLPGQDGDKRGWWGDSFADAPLGSRLWLLSREKVTAEVALRARDYAAEALAWMVGRGIALRVDVATEWQDDGRLAIATAITQPDGSVTRYQHLWTRHAV
ncbi:phage GP46 family protein [Crenobacter cavernae]|uniref:Phage tail protein n=1 Tax=Crenobacter cavernae TaxID=2290923 RepID=A0A345Y6R2_9NEIS|nr:phage GP46 family protein [Crenobacter cavernae]AXK39614.1 hypothetical protein DWG20_09255 [Crenobacter cavernae]